MHEGKNALSPSSHASLAVGRKDRLVSGVIGDLSKLARRHLLARYGDDEPLGNVGLLHETESQFNSKDMFRDRFDDNAKFVGHTRGFGHFYGDQKDSLMQYVVEFHVLREG